MNKLTLTALILSCSTATYANDIKLALAKFGPKNSMTTIHCKTDEVPSGQAQLLFNRYEVKIFRGKRGKIYKSIMNAAVSFQNNDSVKGSLVNGYEKISGSANLLNLTNNQKWSFGASFFISSDFEDEAGKYISVKIDRESGILSSKQKVKVSPDTIGVFSIATEPCTVITEK